MGCPDALRFKLATEPAELEGIHRLNYRTFVEEIPQHPPNPERRLVDRFHEENVYAVCLDGDEVVGMICGRCARPFSLDGKLADLDRHLPPHQRVVEVRLLAVEPRWRQRAVFARLAGTLAAHFRAQGCDLAIVSGALRQLPLYRHLGFRPFGPQVGTPQAPYQPMAMTLADYAVQSAHLETLAAAQEPVLLQPGPVALRPAVSAALARTALSHRSAGFRELFDRVRQRLRMLTHAPGVVLMAGGGTLANDAVAAQLATWQRLASDGRPGLVLVNGEFGQRLQDHARRWQLHTVALHADWGRAFDAAQVSQAIGLHRAAWVWATACETSTGVRNDTPALRQACREQGAALCLDAVSAVGLADFSMAGVKLASAVSGKALGAAAGLALVLHDGALAPGGSLPRCLDLATHEAAEGLPYTLPRHLLAALDAALDIDWPARWAQIAAAHQHLAAELRRRGLPALAADDDTMPGVLTLPLPPDCNSQRLARRMERRGYLLAHASGYLQQRNWLQICLMGAWPSHRLDVLPAQLAGQVAIERAAR